MPVTQENFKWVLSSYRLLRRPCTRSQRFGLLQTSKLLERAADGNAPHVRQLLRFQYSCDDDICGHGTQVWSSDKTSRQSFCARKPASSVIFRFGHSVTKSH